MFSSRSLGINLRLSPDRGDRKERTLKMIAIKQYINLFKLRIGVVITLAALGGMAITPGQSLTSWQVLLLSLSVMMASAAAGAFNQYFERDIDAKMTRTKNRPFLNGYFQHSRKWLVIIGLMLAVAVTSAAIAFNAMTALNIFLGAPTRWRRPSRWLPKAPGSRPGCAVIRGTSRRSA